MQTLISPSSTPFARAARVAIASPALSTPAPTQMSFSHPLCFCPPFTTFAAGLPSRSVSYPSPPNRAHAWRRFDFPPLPLSVAFPGFRAHRNDNSRKTIASIPKSRIIGGCSPIIKVFQRNTGQKRKSKARTCASVSPDNGRAGRRSPASGLSRTSPRNAQCHALFYSRLLSAPNSPLLTPH